MLVVTDHYAIPTLFHYTLGNIICLFSQKRRLMNGLFRIYFSPRSNHPQIRHQVHHLFIPLLRRVLVPQDSLVLDAHHQALVPLDLFVSYLPGDNIRYLNYRSGRVKKRSLTIKSHQYFLPGKFSIFTIRTSYCPFSKMDVLIYVTLSPQKIIRSVWFNSPYSASFSLIISNSSGNQYSVPLKYGQL